jgi:hypothetical protein
MGEKPNLICVKLLAASRSLIIASPSWNPHNNQPGPRRQTTPPGRRSAAHL